MGIICNDIDVNKLTPWEAARNRREMINEIEEDHLKILDNKIREHLLQYLNKMNEFNKKEKTNEK